MKLYPGEPHGGLDVCEQAIVQHTPIFHYILKTVESVTRSDMCQDNTVLMELYERINFVTSSGSTTSNIFMFALVKADG